MSVRARLPEDSINGKRKVKLTEETRFDTEDLLERILDVL